jgi:hypothetical protein
MSVLHVSLSTILLVPKVNTLHAVARVTSAPSGEGPSIFVGQEAGSGPASVYTLKLEEKCLIPVGDHTPVV